MALLGSAAARAARRARSTAGDPAASQVWRTTPRRVRPAYGVTGFGGAAGRGRPRTSRPARRRPGRRRAPTAIAPLPGSPASAAGAAAIQRDHVGQAVAALAGPAVHTAGRPSCSEAIPPHATPKSPVSSRLRSGVHGEWSETTQSITPSASAGPQPLAVGRARGSAGST